MAEVKYIKKIKLSDNSTYYIKDAEALSKSGGIITGDLEVDGKIKTQHLYIMSIETIEVPITNVLTEVNGEIKKRDADNVLEDIGGASYKIINDADGNILSLRIGRQD